MWTHGPEFKPVTIRSAGQCDTITLHSTCYEGAAIPSIRGAFCFFLPAESYQMFQARSRCKLSKFFKLFPRPVGRKKKELI